MGGSVRAHPPATALAPAAGIPLSRTGRSADYVVRWARGAHRRLLPGLHLAHGICRDASLPGGPISRSRDEVCRRPTQAYACARARLALRPLCAHLAAPDRKMQEATCP
eukprot:scaffold177754_cov31-Tisochrysis_lutea.AAC.2